MAHAFREQSPADWKRAGSARAWLNRRASIVEAGRPQQRKRGLALMDDEFVFSLEEVITNIDTSQVMSLFFPAFRKAVVIDTRSNDEEGAMVRILPMAASPQERLRTIRRLRPKFPRLRTLTLIPWPRYVESLVSMGVWDRIVAVVRGENYHTLWTARE